MNYFLYVVAQSVIHCSSGFATAFSHIGFCTHKCSWSECVICSLSVYFIENVLSKESDENKENSYLWWYIINIKSSSSNVHNLHIQIPLEIRNDTPPPLEMKEWVISMTKKAKHSVKQLHANKDLVNFHQKSKNKLSNFLIGIYTILYFISTRTK